MKTLDLIFLFPVLLFKTGVFTEDAFLSIQNLQTNQIGAHDGMVSNRAVDNNTESCSQPMAAEGSKGWWSIDLADNYIITSVIVCNSKIGSTNYLSYFDVKVGFNADVNAQTLCYTYNDVVPAGGNATLSCSTPLIGRYVSVVRNGGPSPYDNAKTLYLCEIYIKGQFYTASNPERMVRYSGTVSGNNPSYVIDDNPTTCCLAAENDDRLRNTTFAWFQVDLGATFSVASVTLTNINTGDSQYLRNFVVLIANTNSTNDQSSPICSTYSNDTPVASLANITLVCSPKPLNGRFVTIKRKGGHRHDALSLCEIKIDASRLDAFLSIQNLQTNQIGAFDGMVSNRAVDGNTESCSQPLAAEGSKGWWSIDLADNYIITSVIVCNSKSGSTNYLSYFDVKVGFNADVNAQTLCYIYNDVVPAGGNATLSCSTPLIGRYVSVVRNGGPSPYDNPKALYLCEIYIKGQFYTVLWTSTTSSTTSTASSRSITMSSTTTTKLTSLSPQSLSAAVQTISITGSSSLIPPSRPTLPTTSTNEIPPMNAGSAAAVVMGILFGMCLAAVVILVIYIVRLRRQNKLNIYATNAAIAEPQRDYEMLRTMHESPREVEPAQIESKMTESIEFPYEEVNIAASSI